MARQAEDVTKGNRSTRLTPRPLPGLGMRGGLGKTLLVAFLLLAIVPLGLLAVLTYSQIQRDTREKVVASLESMVALKEAHLVDWVESYERALSLVASSIDHGLDPAAQLRAVQERDPSLASLALVDRESSRILAGTEPALITAEILGSLAEAGDRMVLVLPPMAGSRPFAAIKHEESQSLLIGLADWRAVERIVTASDGADAGAITYLVTGDGWALSAEGSVLEPLGLEVDGQDGVAATLDGRNGAGAYTGVEGEPVFGAYRWIDDLQLGIVTERLQRPALAAGNALTAMVAGATLAAALVTSALAAVVTRRITRPIVQLTETAAWMARGDLDQQVPVTRRDEIGILARAFNRMAAELRVLYESLEAKVAERTSQLEEANRQTRYYLMQLATSAEVARVATSIRDLDSLLITVVELIGKAFELHHTSIYLLDDDNQWVVWRVGSRSSALAPTRIEVGSASLVGLVAEDGQRRVVREGSAKDPSPESDALRMLRPPAVSQMVVPLRVQQRVLGVLDLHSNRPDDFGEREEMVYQSLADQLSIAIENARAYEAERETVERLRELDRIQSQFLTNMSHALRTPLNTVIGFSRVLLREFDGPLNDTQRADTRAIYDSGRQLLGLINDMLELSQLEIGVAPFTLEEIDLYEIIEGVMATTRALARGKPIQVQEDVADDLPVLYSDGQRVRQVILALLSNAVKLTEHGSIKLKVSADNGHVLIAVTDTGRGISKEERERIFADGRRGEPDGDGRTGFGLAISKRVVEKLGGQVWLESEEGAGATFRFTLPLRSPDQEPERGGTDHVEEP